MSEALIRKYSSADRESVRRIAWQTAFMGEPAEIFFGSREILADFLTLYFTDYEPQSCFVAEADGRVVGYLIGAKNSAQIERVFINKILFPLFLKALFKGAFFSSKNLKYFFYNLFSFLRGDFSDPDFSRDYPATLHINLDKDLRRQDIGSRLISAYLEYLKKENIRGVHLCTMSDKAARFFSHQGFILLHQGKRSYFRHILKKDIPIYIYGKKA